MEALSDYAIRYKTLYQQPILPIFHVACGCVVGQQVRFSIGRNIRKELYLKYGHPINKDLILQSDITIKHLTPARATLIKQMALIDDNRPSLEVLTDYASLPYFGQWTYGAVCILLNLDPHINLSCDSYIRKNIKLYANVADCYHYIAHAKNQTEICYLLWRIKPSSIMKIKNNELLCKEDFI